MTQVAIRAQGPCRDFVVEGGVVRAVLSLSLEMPAGTVFGFLAPNGADKTTTIRLLLGLQEPTAGRADVLGYDSHTQGDLIRAKSGALSVSGVRGCPSAREAI